MENECSNEQIKNGFDTLCMNHTIKTWNKNIITVEFLKESVEENIFDSQIEFVTTVPPLARILQLAIILLRASDLGLA